MFHALDDNGNSEAEYEGLLSGWRKFSVIQAQRAATLEKETPCMKCLFIEEVNASNDVNYCSCPDLLLC